MYIPVLANLYRRHQDPQALSLNDEDIKLIQIAALFHDSAREGEGYDEWDEESAILLYIYLSKVLKIETKKAKSFAEAIANKDKKQNTYRELTTNQTTGELIFIDSIESSLLNEKNIYQKLIHDSDSLDIIRARDHFDASHLDFYKNIAEKNPLAFDEMAKLITEIRSIIETQGDGRSREDPDIKKQYEHAKAYLAIVDSMQNPKVKDERDYSILQKLYADCKILFKENLEESLLPSLEIKQEKPEIMTKEYLEHSLKSGKVFARSILTPSAIRGKIHETDQKETLEETLGSLEIRKALRRLNVPTRTKKPNNKEKQGNSKRSVSMIGHGGSTLGYAGFLIIDPDMTAIHRVYDSDTCTGRHKKKLSDEKKLTPLEAEQALAELLKKLKMGGKSVRFGNRIANHNEITYHILDFDAVYFSQDKNCWNGVNEYYPFHSYSRILQAIFLQKEYEKLTGMKLHIFEYSGLHDFVKLREYSDESIKDMWIEMCDAYVKQQLDKNICPEIFNSSIEEIQTLAMYGCFYNDFAKNNATADSNYSQKLMEEVRLGIQDKISTAISERRERFLKEITETDKSIFDQDIFSQLLNFNLISSHVDIIKKKLVSDAKNEMDDEIKNGCFFNNPDMLLHQITNGFCLTTEFVF